MRLAGAGSPVLLIQGAGVHGDGWSQQVDALAAHYRCLTFDNRGLNRSQPPIVMKQLAALNRYDPTSRLAELSGLPTLVVSAFHDRIARPEFGRALAARVPGTRYVELPDASHGAPIHQPEIINQLLLEHFET